MMAKFGRWVRSATEATGEVAKSAGRRLRWSTKNTMGGLIVTTACEQVVLHGVTWPTIVMCLVGVLPLALSTLEK